MKRSLIHTSTALKKPAAADGHGAAKSARRRGSEILAGMTLTLLYCSVIGSLAGCSNGETRQENAAAGKPPVTSNVNDQASQAATTPGASTARVDGCGVYSRKPSIEEWLNDLANEWSADGESSKEEAMEFAKGAIQTKYGNQKSALEVLQDAPDSGPRDWSLYVCQQKPEGEKYRTSIRGVLLLDGLQNCGGQHIMGFPEWDRRAI